MITTFFSVQSMASHNRQLHTDHGEEQSHQPEALHDLRFAPTGKFEVQMERRHLEHAPAFGKAEEDHLEHYAEDLAGGDHGDRGGEACPR